MSGQRWREELIATAIAVAALTAALGSTGARGSEGRSGGVDLGSAVAVGPAGKVAVAGMSKGRFALARYTVGGRLDRSFGTGGLELTSFGASAYGGANSIAINPDGKMVVAGWIVVPPRTGSAFAIARYTRAGKLDSTFGQNGRVVTYFGRNSAGAEAIASQRDGKIVVAGPGALARYTRRGSLDRTFGRGGRVNTELVSYSSDATAVSIQADGKIVVAGGGRAGPGRTGLALARYDAHGTLDRSFGNRGRVVSKVGEYDTQAEGLVVQPDGKLVVAVNAYVAGDAGFVLARYSRDGKPDPSFGSEGQVFNSAGSVTSLAIQRDRKLVTAGVGMRRYPSFSVARFLEDGTLDPSFGRDGKLLTQFHRTARAYDVVVGADGKIVVAGAYWGRDFAVARYTRTGRLDSSFGSGGKVVTDFGPRR
jgi:uncharacterized delta-60 repeat protein